jgi:hypothetical protein
VAVDGPVLLRLLELELVRAHPDEDAHGVRCVGVPLGEDGGEPADADVTELHRRTVGVDEPDAGPPRGLVQLAAGPLAEAAQRHQEQQSQRAGGGDEAAPHQRPARDPRGLEPALQGLRRTLPVGVG